MSGIKKYMRIRSSTAQFIARVVWKPCVALTVGFKYILAFKYFLLFLLLFQALPASHAEEWIKQDTDLATYQTPSDVGGQLSDSSRIYLFCETDGQSPWPPTEKAQQALNEAASFLAVQKEESLQWNEKGKEYQIGNALIYLSQNKDTYPQVPYYVYIAITDRIQNEIAVFYVHIRFRNMTDFKDVQRILSSIRIKCSKQSVMRDPFKEGGFLWQWDVSYHPVLVIVGSLAEISKSRPDVSIQATYDIWSKFTGPSLANQPTENGFFLLLTKAKVKKVIYADRTLLHTDATIDWIFEGKWKEFNCILPANLRQVGEPDSKGVYIFDYCLSDIIHRDLKPNEIYVLIFKYLNLYPMDGLYLSSVAELKDLEEIQAICAHRPHYKEVPSH